MRFLACYSAAQDGRRAMEITDWNANRKCALQKLMAGSIPESRKVSFQLSLLDGGSAVEEFPQRGRGMAFRRALRRALEDDTPAP